MRKPIIFYSINKLWIKVLFVASPQFSLSLFLRICHNIFVCTFTCSLSFLCNFVFFPRVCKFCVRFSSWRLHQKPAPKLAVMAKATCINLNKQEISWNMDTHSYTHTHSRTQKSRINYILIHCSFADDFCTRFQYFQCNLIMSVRRNLQAHTHTHQLVGLDFVDILSLNELVGIWL